MPNIIQIMPAWSEGNMVHGLIGLEEGGRIWYGAIEFGGGERPRAEDSGPLAVAWRRIEDE